MAFATGDILAVMIENQPNGFLKQFLIHEQKTLARVKLELLTTDGLLKKKCSCPMKEEGE